MCRIDWIIGRREWQLRDNDMLAILSGKIDTLRKARKTEK